MTARNLIPRNPGRGRLGCGQNVPYLSWKCGTPRFCPLPATTDLTWDRHLNNISEAQVVIPLSGNADDTCCDCLGDVEPWCHELHIARDGKDVWLGPVTEVIYEFNQVTIKALDLLGWTTVRVPPCAINFTANPDPKAHDCGFAPRGPADLTTIAGAILDYAFTEDDPCLLQYVSPTPTGRVEPRFFPAFTDTSFTQLDNLSQTGVNYTVVGRTTIIGSQAPPAAPIATLMDSHILGAVQLTKTGLLQANRWYVPFKDDDPPGPGMAEDVVRYCAGLIERMTAAHDEITQLADAIATAQDLVNATPHGMSPRLLEIPAGSRLSPEAPWPIEAMIPGVRVDVGVTRLCVDATQPFLLTGMSVRQAGVTDEEVTLTLGPLFNPFGGV